MPVFLNRIQNDHELFAEAARQVRPEILGSIIDHTLLKPTATKEDIKRLCREANDIGSFICVNGSRVRDVKRCIEDEGLISVRGVAAVIGFPFGAEATREKEAGVLAALCDEDIAEVDMVLNIGKLLEGDEEAVKADILAVARMVKTLSGMKGKKKILKVIQENCSLPTDKLKEKAARITFSIAEEVSIPVFAKTSTGFGVPWHPEATVGATLHDVFLMNRVADEFRQKPRAAGERMPHIGIKAAGGVGTSETAVKFMLAGGCFDENVRLRSCPHEFFRIGASAGKKIVDSFRDRFWSP